MRTEPGNSRALTKLLSLAKTKTDEVSRTIANLEAALVSTEGSLNWLERASKEEAAGNLGHGVNFADLGRYLEGQEAKRSALKATKTTLIAEIEAARGQQAELYAELKKLEHLISVSRQAGKRRMAKNELAALDDAARSRAIAGRRY
jgi:flagellar biosynthesis chaperone FliJ